VAGVEKLRQPEEIEPPYRVGEELADRERPRLAVAQEAEPLDRPRLLGLSARDVRQLGSAALGMLRGRPVDRQPGGEPEKAERTGHDERSAPPPGERDPR